MPWATGILLFTMAVVIRSSSLRADPEDFSEAGAAYGAVSENTVRFGKLLIGGQGTGANKNVKTSALRSEESDGHRTKLHRLVSFVRCSNDSMTLRIPGQRMPHFLVDRGEVVVGHAGMSLLLLHTGAGGSYILPLIIMGAPVQLSCPVSPLLPTVSCFSSGMIVKFGIRADDVKVKVDGSWQPLLQKYTQCSFTLETNAGSLVVTAPFTGSCWEVMDTERRLPLMYGDQEVTLSCPLTQPTIAPTTPVHDPTDMQQMFDPFPFGRPWWYPPYPGVPATLPPTVPPTTPPPPPPQYPFQQPMFPHMYPMPIFDPFYSKGYPFAPPAPQHPWYPKFPPYMNGFQSPVEVTTPATTTTTPAPYHPEHQYPMYPPFYGHQPMKSFVSPTVKYPFMPQYPKDPIFGPRSPKSPSSPALLSSVYRTRR
uniref:Proline-rich protein 36-like n=1 Tax=Sinocyclocheilus rhinocerous TaxID=307959 RepID=A0A673JTZ9_9TELE